jgi:hypothetical protein
MQMTFWEIEKSKKVWTGLRSVTFPGNPLILLGNKLYDRKDKKKVSWIFDFNYFLVLLLGSGTELIKLDVK